MLRHVEDSSLGMCTHAAHAVGGGGDRRKSCATESRSTTCMIPPQRGHFHSGRFEGVPDEAVTAAGLSESWLLEQLETQGKELRSPAVRQEAKDVQTSLLPNDGRISEASSRSFWLKTVLIVSVSTIVDVPKGNIFGAVSGCSDPRGSPQQFPPFLAY